MTTSNEQKAPGSSEKTADGKGQSQQQENQKQQKQQEQQSPKQSTLDKEKDKS